METCKNAIQFTDQLAHKLNVEQQLLTPYVPASLEKEESLINTQSEVYYGKRFPTVSWFCNDPRSPVHGSTNRFCLFANVIRNGSYAIFSTT